MIERCPKCGSPYIFGWEAGNVVKICTGCPPMELFASDRTEVPRTHTVQRGESLYSIALALGTTTDSLAVANPDWFPLMVGDVLKIPDSKGGNSDC